MLSSQGQDCSSYCSTLVAVAPIAGLGEMLPVGEQAASWRRSSPRADRMASYNPLWPCPRSSPPSAWTAFEVGVVGMEHDMVMPWT